MFLVSFVHVRMHKGQAESAFNYLYPFLIVNYENAEILWVFDHVHVFFFFF
jgi:uncharacterized sporulation protein YeaH/YhbH (DUF444 family)